MILWALSFVYIKVALDEISPTTLIVSRFAIGSSILLSVAFARGELKLLRWKDLPPVALLGGVGVTLQQLLQVSGQVFADAGVAAFLSATAPAFLVVLAAILLKERVSAQQAMGVALATGGAVIVSTGGNINLLLIGRFENPGNVLVLLSAVVWAIFTVINRVVVQGRPALLVAAAMMAFGCAFTLPFFIASKGWVEFAYLTSTGWRAIFYVSVLSTALAYLLYSYALKLAPASRVAAIQTIEPIVAVAAAALILNEQVTGALVLGGVAIVAGVYLAERNTSVGAAHTPDGRSAID
jgi:drug/metabolite transporter (DMT)-like permease